MQAGIKIETVTITKFKKKVENCFTNCNYFPGTSGDSLSYHNNMQFSTKDHDHDGATTRSCALLYPSGWWHNDCHRCNPNGLYLHGAASQFSKGITWYHWLGHGYSLKKFEMKIQPKQNFTLKTRNYLSKRSVQDSLVRTPCGLKQEDCKVRVSKKTPRIIQIVLQLQSGFLICSVETYKKGYFKIVIRSVSLTCLLNFSLNKKEEQTKVQYMG